MYRLFILLVVALSRIAISQQKACVQGVVLDEKGAPVPDVRVSLQPLPPKPLLKGVGTTRSGAQGEFHITDMEAGDYWIITSKPSDGYPDTLAAIYGEGRAPKTSLTASTVCSVVTVNLGPKAARLEIDALNADDHTHVSNPRFKLVKLSTKAWTSASADQDILIPADTKVSVEITADGYKPSNVIVLEALHPDEKRHLTVDLHPLGGTRSSTSVAPTIRPDSGRLEGKTGSCVNVKVVDQSQTPVPDVKVSLMPVPPTTASHVFHYVKTSIAGTCTIEGVDPGTYWVVTSKLSDGYPDTGAKIFRDIHQANVTVGASSTCSEALVSIGPKAATLRVVAIDSNHKETIANASATITRLSPKAWIRYTNLSNAIPVPPSTELALEVNAEGYQTSRMPLPELSAGEQRTLTVTLAPK